MCEWRRLLECKVGDGLAEIAIVVNHLVDGIAQLEQLSAMVAGGKADLRVAARKATGKPGNPKALGRLVGLFGRERRGELVEEQRHAVG